MAMKTLTENQHLFELITPINVDAFESLLMHHPNQPFVSSVITGLREGFWPWADTRAGVHPDVYDVSDCPLKFSPAFGPDLPGCGINDDHTADVAGTGDLGEISGQHSGSPGALTCRREG
ncbi:hypothetical protein B0H13DRAFT_2319476 [Mycena leptocephala]|nr:hypothetical protein B0H13DRAFT_2319476 [Mycena leptocephala]